LEKSDPLMVLWPAILQEIERVLSLHIQSRFSVSMPLFSLHSPE
jgi:hypothetical protein